ncbi:hypothetical protein NECAME_11249 [Necator americanus]|uniref:Uncharacterized protein n=1 Tax=Necator americanus TaxID=51031 RepID=W2T7J3_NECAM|nr:hypothetical protein NECAME_11249 [Necator americanus]ETN77136.1 hypothetical protein NECAME_11249 [Necator americanus]
MSSCPTCTTCHELTPKSAAANVSRLTAEEEDGPRTNRMSAITEDHHSLHGLARANERDLGRESERAHQRFEKKNAATAAAAAAAAAIK